MDEAHEAILPPRANRLRAGASALGLGPRRGDVDWVHPAPTARRDERRAVGAGEISAPNQTSASVTQSLLTLLRGLLPPL